MDKAYEQQVLSRILGLKTGGKICMIIGLVLFLAVIIFCFAVRIDKSVTYLSGRKSNRHMRRKTGVSLFAGVIFSTILLLPSMRVMAEADPFVLEGFQIWATGQENRDKGILCTDGPVEGRIRFSDDDPDWSSVVIRFLPQDQVALASTWASENQDDVGGITLPGFQWEDLGDNEYEVRVSFSEEGRWKCTFYCEDLSGNALSGVRDGDSEEFIIDRTPPELSINYEQVVRFSSQAFSPEHRGQTISMEMTKVPSEEGEIFLEPSPGQITVTVREKNFDPDKAEILIEKETYECLDQGRKGNASDREVTIDKLWEPVSDHEFRTRIMLEEEGHYRLTVTCRDMAGLEAVKEETSGTSLEKGRYRSPLITTDQTPPVVHCKVHKTEDDQPPVLELEVEEESFHPGLIRLEDGLYDVEGDLMESLDDEDYSLTEGITWKESYKKGSRVCKASFPLEGEGNHQIKVLVKDGCGNLSKEVSESVTYDVSPPLIQYTGMDNETGDILFVICENKAEVGKPLFYPYSSYRYFSDKKISLKIRARDPVSGVDRIVCRFQGQGYGDESKDGEQIWGKVDETGTITGQEKKRLKSLTGYVEVSAEDFKGNAEVYGLDHSGNKSEKIICPGMISESEKVHRETSSIDFIMSEEGREDSEKGICYFRESPEIRAIFRDGSSGLRQIELNAAWSGGEGFGISQACGEEGKDLLYKSELRMKLDAGHFKGSNENRPLTISAALQDHAGHSSSCEYKDWKFVVDKEAPDITLSYDNNNPVNNIYYREERTARITVKDWNFDEESVLWEIQGKEGSYTISPWEIKGQYAYCNVHFHEDGQNYKVKLTVTDKAGNRTCWDQDHAFTIDRKAPLIRIEMDRKDVHKDYYYNKNKTVRICVEDENIKPENIIWKLHGECDGRPLKMEVKEKGKEGQALVYELSLEQDGEYRISLECDDLALNHSFSEEERLVIDTKKPSVIISGIRNRETFTGRVCPSVTVEDRNKDLDNLHISLIRLGKGDVSEKEVYHMSFRDNQSDWQVSWGDFDRIPETDGIYQIRVWGKDLAGNEISPKKATSLFYVNRFGSVYIPDQETRKLIKAVYTREEEDLHIIEYSVNPVRSEVILVRDNEERILLSEETDYYRKEEGGIAGRTGSSGDYFTQMRGIKTGDETGNLMDRYYLGWIRYDYYIKKENFSREGVYQIRIQSDGLDYTDRNSETVIQTDNEVKKVPLIFTVDKTPPSVKISNLDRFSYQEKEHQVLFTVIDNQELDRFTVTVEKGLFHKENQDLVFKDQDFDDMHRATLTLKSDNTFQRLSYEAVDLAGNSVSSEDLGDSRLCMIIDQEILAIKKKKVSQTSFKASHLPFGRSLVALPLCAITVILICIFKSSR